MTDGEPQSTFSVILPQSASPQQSSEGYNKGGSEMRRVCCDVTAVRKLRGWSKARECPLWLFV